MPDTSPFDLDERMSVIGTEGFIHIQDTFPPPIAVCSKEGFKSPDTTYWPELHGVTGGVLRDEWSYFVRCNLDGTRPTVTTPEEAMEAVRTVLAAHESAPSGAVVMLDCTRAAIAALRPSRSPDRPSPPSTSLLRQARVPSTRVHDG